MLKLLVLGDVVGEPGRRLMEAHLPDLRREYAVDFVVVNGENAAHGNGITERIAKDWFENLGVDVITTGNHAFDTRDLNTDTQPGNDLAVGFNGRNGYRQPSTKQFDLRLTRPFRIWKSMEIEASIDVFNVFNWANQTTTLQSAQNATGPIADFGFINNPDRNTREMQFAIRARF